VASLEGLLAAVQAEAAQLREENGSLKALSQVGDAWLLLASCTAARLAAKTEL
jgi:hypothetical protein